MPSPYDHFELRIEVCGPVATESPFDSGTLWGRIIHALSIGSEDERSLATQWLSELSEQDAAKSPEFVPPLIVSEGFSCDASGEPWLPCPLFYHLELQLMQDHERGISSKELNRISRVPKKFFARICNGEKLNSEELQFLLDPNRGPKADSALTPHLGMDRLTGTGREGLLYMTQVSVYRTGGEAGQTQANETSPRTSPQVVFFVKLRRKDGAYTLVKRAMERICLQGWGQGVARGLGHIQFTSFDPSSQPPDLPNPVGFVSLSHFTPAVSDPTDGYWWLNTKHPVPAPFISGRPVRLGEDAEWRVKSFLRLQAGSCLMLRTAETLRPYYGRTLSNLLSPAEDRNGDPLPTIFHYALGYPWPVYGSLRENKLHVNPR
jgi:hypothetical protein